MYKSYSIRLKPTKEQEQKMFQTIGACRFAWNWGLNYMNNFYKDNGKGVSARKTRDEFIKLKKDENYIWLNNVSSQALASQFENLDKSFKMFFKSIAKYPRFKKKKDTKQSFFVRPDNMSIKLTDNTVNLEKIGRVRFKSNQKIPIAKYSTPTCSFNGKYWILSFGVIVENQNVTLTDEIIGIDLGVKTLMVCSNGFEVKNINKSSKMILLENKLKRLQRICSRKYEMNKQGNKFIKTSNIIKLEKKIKNLYKRITDIRTNEIHQATNKIVNSFPKAIVIEDLNVKGMMKNKNLAKSISDCKFYEIRRQLEYKSLYKGIKVIVVDRWFPSSKTCNSCGNINKSLNLSDRVYNCGCGYSEDRDLNASFNLRDYGVKFI